MKNIATFVITFLLFGNLCAQNVVNGSFETWNQQSISQAASWQTTGNVSRTTDVFEGAYAVKLENTVSTQGFGLLATGPFDNEKIEGIPYDEQPLSMRFRAKYNLANGDKAQVAAIFTLKGQTLAFANFYIEGNSADTFAYFSVPITFQIATNPDSVALAISSIDLENNEVNGDGYLIIDDLHFATISTRNRTIPNGNFNEWITKTSEHASGWFTTDDYIHDLTGFTLNPQAVKKSSNAKSGSFALELKSQVFGGDTLPGLALTGKSVQEIQKPAFPIAQKWKFVEGYYQCKPENGDSASIAVFVYKNGVPIGYANGYFTDQKTSYTYFAFPINYQVQLVPDSASVIISSCNPDHPRGTNSWLLVDDVKFTDKNLSVFDFNFNKLTVFPNPFIDQINITGIDKVEGAVYTLADVHGRTIREGMVQKDMQIDVRDAAAGVYFLRIEGRYIKTDKILLKE